MVNEIRVQVNFLQHTLTKKDTGIVEGDYNSTKLIFEFEEESVAGQNVIFQMSNPYGELVLMKELTENEIMLVGYDEDGKMYSLFPAPGLYPFELVIRDDDKLLTSAPGWLNVSKRQVDTGSGGGAEYYLPLFEELFVTCQTSGEIADEAIEIAEEALEKGTEALGYAETAKEVAIGITTIEQNNQTPLKFWVGSQEEYDAIVEPDQGCFYIIEDDDTYGLGGNAKNIAKIDLNDVKTTGWYFASSGLSVENLPFSGYAIVNVIASELIVVQIAYPFPSDNRYYNSVVRRTYDAADSTWCEWEFENPLMLENVEYRTCERYLGKPVYTKIVSIPTSAEKEGEDESPYYIDAPHGIENFGTIKSVSAILKYSTMSTDMSNLSGYVLAIDSEDVTIYYDISIATDSVGGNAGTIYVELKYTKE